MDAQLRDRARAHAQSEIAAVDCHADGAAPHRARHEADRVRPQRARGRPPRRQKISHQVEERIAVFATASLARRIESADAGLIRTIAGAATRRVPKDDIVLAEMYGGVAA